MLNTYLGYKLSNYFYRKKLYKFSRLTDKFNFLIHKSIVYGSTKIGEGTTFAYGGLGLVIIKSAIIGKNCTIGQGVTIGSTYGENKIKKIPVLEDNIYLGPGSKVIGGVKVSHDCIIAPNCVVTKDIPPYSIVAGIPGKVIKRITKIDFEKKYKYYGIEGYFINE